MDGIDLEFWLLLVTIITGIIWLGYWLYLRKTNTVKKPEEYPLIVDYARSFFPVLFIVLFLRSFVAEPFRIPSGSMLPTLEVGDFILVNKMAYGIRLPVWHNKIIDTGEPERGDVVVFRYPENPKLDYIKRLVGKPGDLITWNNKLVSINGIPLKNTKVGLHDSIDQHGQTTRSLRLTEDLAGVKHDILILPQWTTGSGELLVPKGHYFVMGDNRDRSNDSRMWGLVPEENLVGKASYVWLHWNFGNGWPSLSRAGSIE